MPTRYALFAALAVPVAAVANPSWVYSNGLDLWNIPAEQRVVAEEEAIGRRLDQADATVRARMAAKEARVNDLLAGRSTLADTADAFRSLGAFDGPLDADAAVRAVVRAVRARLGDKPDQAATLAAIEAAAARTSAGN